MSTTPEQLTELLAAPEGSRIEFKSATGGYHFDKLVEYCVAIANEGGGKIILGVSDERPRTVVGTSAFAEPGRTEAGLHERLGHRVPVEELHRDGKRILIVHVPGRLPGTAWNIDGKFSTYDFLALDAIAREQPLTEAMRSQLPGLIEIGVVESQGRGRGTRYHLSRGIHTALGRKGTYTRKRGLDHETNKALLLKHLRDNAEAGAPLAELCQVLPALSRRSIQRLLAELREEGKTTLRGQRKGALWFPSDMRQKEGAL